MEQTLIEAAKQVPSLAVLSVIVWLFIRHIEAAGKAWRDTVIDIHRENLEARTASRDTIKENTLAGIQNTKAIADLTNVVGELARRSK